MFINYKLGSKIFRCVTGHAVEGHYSLQKLSVFVENIFIYVALNNFVSLLV